MSEERIRAVENGLLPVVTIAGRLPAPMNLAERMGRYKVPGLSIAVIDRAKIDWARGYGLRSAAEDIPIAPDTRFQAASISKPVSAMAALHLVQTGDLELDADVNRVLRSWHVPENEHTREQKVTLRRLLSHTAGLTVSGFRGYAADEKVPSVGQVLDGVPPANSDPVRVDLVPGSEFRYSGGGYVVMQQLLEDVTGRSFAELVQATVLDPLGMQHSTFEQPLPLHLAEQAAIAHGHEGQPLDGRWHTYPERAAAGLWTTPSDLARFAIEVIESNRGQSNKILSQDLIGEMLTPPIEGYGLGLAVRKLDDGIQFRHAGGNEGYRCSTIAYTGSGQGAVVMTNSDNGDYLVAELLRGIARIYGWPGFEPEEKTAAQVDPAIWADYEGTYHDPESPEWGVVISRVGDWLVLRTGWDDLCFELYAASEARYFALERDQEIEFVRDEAGQVDAIMIDAQWRMQKAAHT